MTLYIHTKQAPLPWLNYILEEFRLIQQAEFEIVVTATQPEDSSVIHYHDSPLDGITIPNRSSVKPDGKTEKINPNVFVLPGTKAPGFSVEYDMLWNAFVFLSRLEEWQAEKNGALLRSYALKHPRQKKSTFLIPVVNHIFGELHNLISEHFPQLTFASAKPPVIELSHDLDYIVKTIQLRLKQSIFNSFNLMRSVIRPGQLLPQIGKTVSFLFSNPSYWCFDYWTSMENQFQTKSTFYIHAHAGKGTVKSWLFDPSYKVEENKKLVDQLNHMRADGFEIGMHGGMFTAISDYWFHKEKQSIEDSLGFPIEKTRQHWLRYEEQKTPKLHEKYVKFDSTVGFNDRMGFRAGCASVYHPYDHENERAFSYQVIPLSLMDSNIFDYGADKRKQQERKAIQLLEHLRVLPNAHVSICWHPRTCSPDYNWHHFYEQLLERFFQKV